METAHVKFIFIYRQTGWIGTAGLKPGETQRQNDSPGLPLCLSRLEPRVPIHLHCPDQPRLTVAYIFMEQRDKYFPHQSFQVLIWSKAFVK